MLAYPAMLTDVVRAVKEAESKEPAIFGRNGVHSLMYGKSESSPLLCLSGRFC